MTTTSPVDILKAFLQSMNEEDFDRAKTFANDDLIFEGVMGSRNGAALYFSDMAKMKFKYEIRKIVGDDNDVSVLYDIDMGGKKLLTSGWYHFEHNKISSIRVIFDPRPLLEKEDQQ